MSIDTRVNQEDNHVVTEEKATPPAQITVSQIVEDLENGRDRKVIKAKYGLTADEVKMIFEHPKLKGMRVKKSKVMRFTLVDDTVDAAQTSIPMASLEETAEMLYGVDNANVEVQSFPSSGGWDNQTRVEEGLDHKGSYNNNQTEIQD
tara:strand:+ start:2730 stop:3173 length:444 start_codon:yes stop_codon:yes gene_type:complete